MFFTNPFKSRLPEAEEALKGRAVAIMTPGAHAARSRPIAPPFPEDVQLVQLGMGCFWGAERLFWTQKGSIARLVAERARRNTPMKRCVPGKPAGEVVLVAFQHDILSFGLVPLPFFRRGIAVTLGQSSGKYWHAISLCYLYIM